MKPLNRPMFRYGGPIKLEGCYVRGYREPKQMAGSRLSPFQCIKVRGYRRAKRGLWKILS